MQLLTVRRTSRLLLGTILALPGLLGAGCANMNHAQSGALAGTALGTIAGAAIGSNSGHAAGGAVIGAITGAMAGTVIGDAEDARVERDSALAQRDSAIIQAQYQAQQQAQALTNFDLIRLTQSGVSDDVIVNMISSRGGNFDLTTDSVIAMKNNGVSDRVLVAAQTAPKVSPALLPASSQPGVVVVQPQPTVIVESGPPVVGWGYHHYWGPHRHFHHHHRHHPRSSVGVSFGF